MPENIELVAPRAVSRSTGELFWALLLFVMLNEKLENAGGPHD